MVGKITGPVQVERHEGCDVMCYGMDLERINIHSHIHPVSVSVSHQKDPRPGLLQPQHGVRHTCEKLAR
jgi:hypothetical protein